MKSSRFAAACRSARRHLNAIVCLLAAAAASALPVRAQIQWSTYSTSGALVGTSGQAATFDPATGTYTFTIPASTQQTFITTNIASIPLTAPGSGSSMKSVSFTMTASGGFTSGTANGGRNFFMGLFDTNGTAPGATGNFTDDKGVWTDARPNTTAGSFSSEGFAGAGAAANPTPAGLLAYLSNPVQLGSSRGPSAGALGSLTDGLATNVTFRVRITDTGAIYLGDGTAVASAGAVYQDAATGGTTLNRTFASNNTSTLLSGSQTFNVFALALNNSTASAVTFTVSNFNGLTAPPYFITQPPANATVSVGGSVSLNASVGGAPASYQWEKSTNGGTSYSPIDSVANPSAATATLSLTNAQSADDALYRLVATNAAGASTSTAAALAVSSGSVAPSILTHPAGLTVLVGQPASFTVAANGTGPLTYQWKKDGNDIPAASASTYSIVSTTLADTASYTVVVTNGAGSATSNAASLTVHQLPEITTQPTGATVQPGAPITLSVAATGVPAVSYQWKKNGVNISNATSDTYAVASATGADTGAYTVVVTNAAGSVTSTAAAIAVVSSSMAVTATTPVTASTNRNTDTRLTITFNEAVTPGVSGYLRIYDASNDSVVDTIDLAAATAQRDTLRASSTISTRLLPVQIKNIGGITTWNYYPITVSGNTATIHPRDGVLAYGKTYYVKIDAGVFVNASGESFTGIANNTTWTFSTKSSAPALGTLITVAADGSGDFDTVQGALDFIPVSNTTARTLYIKNGTYFEQIAFQAKNNLTLLGESAELTVIDYPNNNNFNNASGVYHRGTLLAQSVNGLVLANFTIRNSTPQNGSQAEALIIKGSATTGRNLATRLKLYSYQDTLQVDGQFYMSDSYIEGDVDFLWGNGPSFFRNCDFKILRTGGYFAQVRNGSGNHGFVFHNCRFTAAAGITGTFFNRIDPNNGQYPNSEMVLLDSVIGDATNNNFLNTNVGASGSSYQTGWWLLNNSAVDVATIHHWDNNSVDKDGAPLTFASRPASTIMPTDATTQANYRDAYWVLNTTIAGSTTAGNWTPALAPLFLTHPAAASVSAGQPVTLTASTAAVPSATYQWKKDGNDISGATSATYTIASAVAGDSGTYTVVATNASGSTTSNPAVVSVGGSAVSPTITTDPASQSVTVGANVTFTVAATGTAPFTYQWKKGAVDISGATNATLTLSSVTTADSGAYSVVVTNSAGSATSNAASLTVNGLAGISLPDGFAASVTGGAAGPTVTVTTVASLRQYAEAAATSPYVIIVSGTLDLGNGGRVNVKSNKTIKGENTAATIVGTLSISNATNIIISNLNITAPTGDTTDNDQDNDAVTVAASTYVLITKCSIYDATDGNLDVVQGSDFITVSWCKFYYNRTTAHRFSNLIGSSDTDTGAGGQYRMSWHHNWWSTGAMQRMLACRFGGAHMYNNYWDCAGNDYATEARNTAEMLSEHNAYNGVKNPLAKRTALPTDQSKLMTIGNLFTNCTGNQATTTDIVFSPPYSYPLIDAANVAAIVQAGAGNVAADAPMSPGSATISGASSVATGGSVTLTATAAGFAPTSYQWRFKNAAITGATSATLARTNAQSSDAGAYTVVLGVPGGGYVVSSPLTLAVTAAPAAPSITTQPASLTVTTGASASFSVSATGDAPLTYQWKKDGTDISGATSATYTIATTASSSAASYTVVVTNGIGSATSTAATLTVLPAFTAPTPDGFGASATGGGSTAQVLVTTAADFRTQAESNSAAVITVSGTLNLGSTKVAVKSNKTIQGLDANATLVGNLELASGVSNVVIRGLNITNAAGDGITLAGATNVYIAHVTFFDCSDTLLRIGSGSDNVTVSWCEFYYTASQTAHRYATLIGAATGETKALRVTLSHNWYSDRVDQQQPDSTWGQVHLYNNYFNPNGTANTSGSIARANTQFLSERNQYTGIVSPLTKTGGGLIRAIGNVYTSTTGTAADAGNDTVFTPTYSYHLRATADLPTLLLSGAGNTAGAASASLTSASASINASATTVTAGSSFTLTAVPSISAVNGWQWRLNNADIAGATSQTYTVSSAQAANAGIYTVVASNVALEGVVSSPATITVNAAPVTPPATPSSGGGGAPSVWFLAVLATLSALRRFFRRK